MGASAETSRDLIRRLWLSAVRFAVLPAVDERRAEDLEIAAAFGQRVRNARLDRELTQEQLAEASGLHSTFISNLERGYRVPTLPTVIRVARGLDCRLEVILAGLDSAE